MSHDTPNADFVRQIVAQDRASGKHGGRVQTRFPPEPNGYLHIGHAKAIVLNFGIAAEFGGLCNLRFDDTNPTTEDVEYVDAIQRDVRWLGYDWDDRLFFASDFYEQMYAHAVALIEAGKAYVDSLDADSISEYRGTITTPGKPSPYRDRSVAENLDLFARMRAGEFAEGEHVLRAKIDLASPNMLLRDPVMYRIRKVAHYRTGDRWCIYPMYDYAHPICDSLEKVTHSLCTLEFETHRPLYDWFLRELGLYHPQQIEFARLNIDYTVMSKRKLLELVDGGHVSGWDDPRLPTLSGLRRRGYPAAAIRKFCEHVGVARFNATHEIGLLEFVLREHLNRTAPRAMAVLRPLKVVIENWPGGVVMLDAVNNPEDPAAGSRKVPFSGELWIEHDDFREDPPKQFFRLAPGREVRLRYAFFIRCTGVVKDTAGNVVELRATYDPQTLGGSAADGRKVKATIHWVSAQHSVPAQVRLYEHLFTEPEPGAGGVDFKQHLNPKSLEIVDGAQLEPSLAAAAPGAAFQFERLGYFCADSDSTNDRLVFNRTVTLRDAWAKIEKANVAAS